METKDFGYDKNVFLKEISDNVFEKISEGEYKCIKNRTGDLIVGGIYTPFFVDSYSKFVKNTVLVNKE